MPAPPLHTTPLHTPLLPTAAPRDGGARPSSAAARDVAATGRRRLAGRMLLGLALFLLVDGLVFRSGFYFWWVDPLSSSGGVAQALDNARHASPADRTVLLLGDSRLAEGFSARTANELAAAAGQAVDFINGAVPGTTPRVWYYMLREMLRERPAPASLLIMTDSYHDNNEVYADVRVADLAFLHPLLFLSDLWSLAASFPNGAGRLAAAQAVLLGGLYYKNDLADFIKRPAYRIAVARLVHAHGFEFGDAYPGRDGSLAGLRMEPSSGTISLPPGVSPPTALAPIADYAKQLHIVGARPADNASSVAYRSLWFDRIASLCAAHGIKLFVLRVPRGPLHFMVDPDGSPTGVLAAMQQAGRLQLLPATQFDDLERPELFFDAVHLNAAGRMRFSTVVANQMLPRLGAAP